MRFLAFILSVALFMVSSVSSRGAEVYQSSKLSKELSKEEILHNLRKAAEKYSAATPDYEAQVYINGNVDVQKIGSFLKFMPYINKIDKGEKHYSSDYIGAISFTNPNIYNQSLYNIGLKNRSFINEYVDILTQQSLKLSPYSQYLLGNLYSPLAYLSGRYYTYTIDPYTTEDCNEYLKVSFQPKINNHKFVEGYMVVSQRNWSLRELHFTGNVEFVEFSFHAKMGKESSPQEFLPQQITISSKGGILGTHFTSGYVSKVKYTNIHQPKITNDKVDDRDLYDLTLQYNTNEDTLSLAAEYIRNFREQMDIKDTVEVVNKAKAIKRVAQFMVKDYSIDLRKNRGELSLSPLVSPILFDYSTSNGLSYNQKLKYKTTIAKDKMFSIEPQVGYNLKYTEFYASLKGEFIYLPKNMGSFYLDLGNGNKFYINHNSNDLAIPNPLVYRTSHVALGHKIEIANGLLLKTKATFLRFKNIDNFTGAYNVFVPEVEIKFTPGQYYYMNGNRKEYLYSRYPTFTLNAATAIDGAFGSSIKYNQVEFDIQHKLQVGPMHNFHYRVGAGGFFNYNDIHFAVFNNLRRNGLPEGWNDDIGGTFHLLTPVKYSDIDRYLRASVKFDAPLLLVPTLLKRVKYITKECLYCNMLLTNTMDPYIEAGYGIGTAICNIGIFWGGEITKWDMLGIKFTFEAFN